MSNELAPVYTEIEEKKELIKSLYCKNLTDHETQHFFAICHKRKLNPLTNQIYVWKFGQKMTIIVSIDGLRLIAERTKKYAPGKETVFSYKKDGTLLNATAYVKKQTVDGTWHEVSAMAFFDEFNDPKKDTWRKMPHVMLSKCAEANALRRAFPEDLSGMYTQEEMDHVEEEKSDQVTVEPEVQEDITIEKACQTISSFMGIENNDSLKEYVLACKEKKDILLVDLTNKLLENKERFMNYFEAWKAKQSN